jgi:alpha-L-arabinofuranosidase
MPDPIDSIPEVSRRSLLKVIAGAGAMATLPAGVAIGQSERGVAKAAVTIDPTPKFDLSPHLYMQFMEPLGTNDSSVEASWDHLNDCWRPDRRCSRGCRLG